MPGTPRPWKRAAFLLFRLAGWGAVGVAVSFLVCIACVLRADASGSLSRRSMPGNTPWLWNPRVGWAPPTDAYDSRSRWVDLDDRLWMHGTPDRRATLGVQQEYRAGWPLRAWRWRRDWAPGDAEPPTLFETGRLKLERGFAGAYWVSGPTAATPSAHIVTFPLTPNGWAFAGSVLLFGGAAWGLKRLVVGAWGWRRERRRRRVGGCRGCLYPVEGMDRCPECGRPADRRMLGSKG